MGATTGAEPAPGAVTEGGRARVAPAALALSSMALALPRVTAGPCAPRDVALELLVWLALPLLLAQLLRGRWPGVERALACVLPAALCALVVTMTFASHDWPRFWAYGLGTLALSAALAFASPAALATPLCAVLSALLVWLVLGGGVPWSLLSLLLLWGVVTAALVATRARWLAPVLAALVALAPGHGFVAPAAWDGQRAPADGPDVVLLVVDTLRHDASQRLKVARKLAALGSDFGPAQSSSSWTLPSMASIMTGAEVAAHGAANLQGQHRKLGGALPTLAERLAARGYDTAAVLAANPFVGEGFGLQRGFDVADYDGRERFRFQLPLSRGGRARPSVTQLLLALRLWVEWLPLQQLVDEAAQLGDAGVVQRVRQLLSVRRDRPLMLWVHLMGMHQPMRHAAELEGVAAERVLQLSRPGLRHGTVGGDPFWSGPEGRALLRRAYFHELSHLDRHLQAILDALGPAPPRGRLLVLTADHGEELFEHGGYEHGHSYYQEVVAVPLIFSGAPAPGSAAGHGPGALIDVAPTVLGAVGIGAPPSMVGLDLGRASVEQTRGRALVTRNVLYDTHLGDVPQEETCAVRRDVLKAIRLEAAALYDLARDPAELQSLHATQGAAMAAMLDGCAGELQQGEPAQMSDAEVKALRALGYVQ